jgi:hypothetical protein
MYFDGDKIYDNIFYDDYSATLNVLTYPDEFLPFDGVAAIGKGLFAEDQKPSRFSLSYRTRVGDDLKGAESGYKIHLVYNLTAIPDATSYSTISGDADPIEFSWDVSGIPEVISGYNATAHAILDTRKVNKYLLSDLYDIIYGTDTVAPRLPGLNELTNLVASWNLITITDNGDDTWTATGPDEYFSTLADGSFQITGVDATYLDADTYTVSTTHA